MNYDLKLFKKPLPFSSGNMTLWENAYIAENVLNKHLDKSMDSGSRKWETIVNTVDWICGKKTDACSVLDIGCGPGLYAKLFDDFGLLYTGIDISPYQIEYAKQSNHQIKERVNFYQADFLKWKYTGKHDIVLLLYGIYSFFPRNERVSVLKNIKRALPPQGCVIIEVFTRNHYANRNEERDWSYIEKNGFWSEKPYLELNAFYRYDDTKAHLEFSRRYQRFWNQINNLVNSENRLRSLRPQVVAEPEIVDERTIDDAFTDAWKSSFSQYRRIPRYQESCRLFDQCIELIAAVESIEPFSDKDRLKLFENYYQNNGQDLVNRIRETFGIKRVCEPELYDSVNCCLIEQELPISLNSLVEFQV